MRREITVYVLAVSILNEKLVNFICLNVDKSFLDDEYKRK